MDQVFDDSYHLEVMFFFQPFDDVLDVFWSVIIGDIVWDIKTN